VLWLLLVVAKLPPSRKPPKQRRPKRSPQKPLRLKQLRLRALPRLKVPLPLKVLLRPLPKRRSEPLRTGLNRHQA
jgi:hypothetical protein